MHEAERDHRLTKLRVADLAYTHSTGLRYRKDGYLPPVATRFIEILQKTAANIASE